MGKKSVFLVKILLPFLFLFFVFELLFFNRIYPNVFVAGHGVERLTKSQAIDLLQKNLTPPQEILLYYNDQSFSIPTSSINLSFNFPQSIENAFKHGRSKKFTENLTTGILSLVRRKDFELIYDIDEQKLDEHLSVLAGQVAIDPVLPFAKIIENRIVIEKGKNGKDLNLEKIKYQITQNISFNRNFPIRIETVEIETELNDLEIQTYKNRLEKLSTKTLRLEFESNSFEYGKEKIIAFIEPKGGYFKDSVSETVTEIAKEVDRVPQNPKFVFNGNRVKEFAPAKNGVEVNKPSLEKEILENLKKLETTQDSKLILKISAKEMPPLFRTEDVNNLGIKELLGKGTSRFKGSIPGRVHNLTLASSKFNGVLIYPGQTLSFNEILGDVSAYTGYKQAFIIKDGKTVLGDGGGVCQVSTTLFRAALNAGLPIVERRGHSYRVGYYEQDSAPGIDATVFAPTTDLKIENNTPGHLLIQTSVDTKNASLLFEIYGSSDGRTVQISRPTITNLTPPPPDLYQDDPTLQAGAVKQIDYKAWGAKTAFNYTVTRGNETIYKKTFVTNYRPWQAVFLKGTGGQTH